jgi:hypothetical protein
MNKNPPATSRKEIRGQKRKQRRKAKRENRNRKRKEISRNL